MSSTPQFDKKVERLLELREETSAAKSVYDDAKRRRDMYERSLWEELESDFGNMKTYSVELEDGRHLRLSRNTRVLVSVTDKEAAVKSLSELGLIEAIGEPNLKKAILNEWGREWYENGAELPEGLEIYEKQTISVKEV